MSYCACIIYEMESVINNALTKTKRILVQYRIVIISSSILEPNAAPVGGEGLAKGDVGEGKRSERTGVKDGGKKEGEGR